MVSLETSPLSPGIKAQAVDLAFATSKETKAFTMGEKESIGNPAGTAPLPCASFPSKFLPPLLLWTNCLYGSALTRGCSGRNNNPSYTFFQVKHQLCLQGKNQQSLFLLPLYSEIPDRELTAFPCHPCTAQRCFSQWGCRSPAKTEFQQWDASLKGQLQTQKGKETWDHQQNYLCSAVVSPSKEQPLSKLIPFEVFVLRVSLLVAPSQKRMEPWLSPLQNHCPQYSHSIIFVADLRLFLEALKISKGHLFFLFRHSIFLCLIEIWRRRKKNLLSINMPFY